MGNHGHNGESLKKCLLQPLGAPWEQMMMLSSKSVQHFIRVIRVKYSHATVSEHSFRCA